MGRQKGGERDNEGITETWQLNNGSKLLPTAKVLMILFQIILRKNEKKTIETLETKISVHPKSWKISLFQ